MERHPRVLVVDDDEPVRHMVAMAFRFDGFDVGEAGDGVQAIAQVEMFHPDVVVLDIMMPRMDGLSTLGHLRQQPGTTDLPVVLLSAKAAPTDIAIGMRAGANDYVTKPFVTDELLERARKAMQEPTSTSRARIAATSDSPGAVRRTMQPSEARLPTPPPRIVPPRPAADAPPRPAAEAPRPAPEAPPRPAAAPVAPSSPPPPAPRPPSPPPPRLPAPKPPAPKPPASPPRTAAATAPIAPPPVTTAPAAAMPANEAPPRQPPPGRGVEAWLRAIFTLCLIISLELIVVIVLLAR
jgi:CheY-like chemotaxis protein